MADKIEALDELESSRQPLTGPLIAVGLARTDIVGLSMRAAQQGSRPSAALPGTAATFTERRPDCQPNTETDCFTAAGTSEGPCRPCDGRRRSDGRYPQQ